MLGACGTAWLTTAWNLEWEESETHYLNLNAVEIRFAC